MKSNLTFSYGSEQVLQCKYGRAVRTPGTFKAECLRAAHLIRESTNRPIAVMLSGGLDSEVVLRSFMDAGIQVQAWTYSLGAASIHELAFMNRVTKQLGVSSQIFEFSERWLDTPEAATMFRDGESYFIEMVPHMRMLSHLNDLGYHAVMGNGEVLLEKSNGMWEYVELEYDLAWYRFCEARGIEASVGFFQQTAELQLAALLHPRTVSVVSGEDVLANKILLTTRPVKYRMYKDEWPDIRLRQKYDGAEQFRDFSMKRSIELRETMSRSFNSKVSIPYADMIKRLECQELEGHPSTD